MPENKYRQNPVIAWREIDSEAVLVAPQTGHIRVFNRTGSVIWSFCGQARTLAEIAKYLSGIFEVTSKEAHEDVRVFIEECLSRDLIQIAPPDI